MQKIDVAANHSGGIVQIVNLTEVINDRRVELNETFVLKGELSVGDGCFIDDAECTSELHKIIIIIDDEFDRKYILALFSLWYILLSCIRVYWYGIWYKVWGYTMCLITTTSRPVMYIPLDILSFEKLFWNHPVIFKMMFPIQLLRWCQWSMCMSIRWMT